MITTKQTILTSTIILSLTALAPQISSAEAPTGSLTNVVTSSTNALWDLSLVQGLQNISVHVQKDTSDVEVAYAAPLTQDGRGKLAGIGTSDVSLTINDDSGASSNNFVGVYMSKGSISSSKGVVHLAFSTKVAGQAFLEGATRKLSAAATYTVRLDGNLGQVTGRTSERASAAGLGSLSDRGTIGPEELPTELGDGSWALVLNFQPPTAGSNTNKLSGDATVALQTGQVYPFTFTGVFSPKNQQTKLNLKGHDAGLGCILQVTLQTNQFTRIVGRVSGQSVNIK